MTMSQNQITIRFFIIKSPSPSPVITQDLMFWDMIENMPSELNLEFETLYIQLGLPQ